MGHLSSKEGQIILGSAVVDDVLAIILLAVVALQNWRGGRRQFI